MCLCKRDLRFWSRKWQHTPVFFPGKSHGQRSLMDYSPQGCKCQTDLSNKPPPPPHYVTPGGEYSNPLQYSCLQSSLDRGALWTTVQRITNSLIWLKQFSTQAHRHCVSHIKQYSLPTGIITEISVGKTLSICVSREKKVIKSFLISLIFGWFLIKV